MSIPNMSISSSAEFSCSEAPGTSSGTIKIEASGPLSNSKARKMQREADRVIDGTVRCQRLLHHQLEMSLARVASHPQTAGSRPAATEEGLSRANAEITYLQGIISSHVRDLQVLYDRNDGFDVPEHK